MPSRRSRDKVLDLNSKISTFPEWITTGDRWERAVVSSEDAPAIALYEAEWGPGGWESLTPLIRNAWRRAARVDARTAESGDPL